MVRGILAEVLGLPHSKVKVLVDHMGGGFGAKQDLFQTEFLCALLARETRRPVRLEYTRKETFLGGRSRHPATVWLKQGFRKDGTITARKVENAVREGDLWPSGHAIVGHGLEDCIRRGMEETDWPRKRNDRGHVRRGWGMGCEMHGSSAYPGIKEQGNATVRMNEDGTLQLFTGTTGLGTGAHTALAQVVAEEIGVGFDDVSVVHGDTDVVPWDIGAFASHTTYMGGRAAQMAAAEVRKQLLERAAESLE